MRRHVFVLLVGVIALGASIAAAQPRPGGARRGGKAVRVPRPSATVATAARFCTLDEEGHGVCFGPASVGETGTVMSSEQQWGQTDVLEVTPLRNGCGAIESWRIRVDRTRIQASYYDATFILGMPLSPEARLLSPDHPVPSGNADASIMYVVDGDGDGHGDLLVDRYACGADRKPARASDATHQCWEYWVGVRDRWQRGRVDQVPSCNR